MAPEYYVKKLFVEILEKNIINPMALADAYEYALLLVGIGFDLGHCEGAKQPSKRKKIEKFNKLGEYMNDYNSMSEAAIDHNVDKSTISKAIKGGYKTDQGFYWKISK